MPTFNFCLVADDVRLELYNKASIIGFYGILPHAEIEVDKLNLPIYKLTFLLISGAPVQPATYHVRLSVKDPRGKELMQQDAPVSASADVDITAGRLNTIIACLPFPLAGVGTYTVSAIVNDIEDFCSTLQIAQQSPVN